MKIVISPAKTLDFETKPPTTKTTHPLFATETKELLSILKKFSPDQISDLMDISPKLADLNYERFQKFGNQPKKQAMFAFAGDVYDGLKANDFTTKEIDFAQKHLLMLSGLYGMLRPLDLIEAYRLEMGTNLKNKKGKTLYDFWGDKLTKHIENDLVINLASVEYFSSINPKNVLNVDFKENKNGKITTIALFSKKARGMMARYIIKNQITDIKNIKNFYEAGYEFSNKLSTDTSFVFVRKAQKK